MNICRICLLVREESILWPEVVKWVIELKSWYQGISSYVWRNYQGDRVVTVISTQNRFIVFRAFSIALLQGCRRNRSRVQTVYRSWLLCFNTTQMGFTISKRGSKNWLVLSGNRSNNLDLPMLQGHFSYSLETKLGFHWTLKEIILSALQLFCPM